MSVRTVIAISLVIAVLAACGGSTPEQPGGWRNLPGTEIELEGCIGDSVRSFGDVLSREEAHAYCVQVFDCIWAKEESLYDTKSSTLFECVEDVLEDFQLRTDPSIT